MSNRTRSKLVAVALVVGGLGVAVAPHVARACGPDFDSELLSQRTTTLFELQARSFTTEAAKLVPVPAAHDTLPPDDAEPDGVRTRGSPQERTLYERGAAAFAAGDLDGADDAFTALLALPRAQRLQRSTWAAYMLGRTYQHGADAIAAYQRVRALVADGFADELGLAASSLGQEAREHYLAGEVPRALRLYAEQAARGHHDGAASLLLLAQRASSDADDRRAMLADPLGQRVLSLYLATRADELLPAQVDALWAALAAVPAVAGADQLAGAAYRAGRWALAGQLARQDPHATLSLWVLAKLALRAGDRATGDRLLAEVSTAMTADAAGCSETPSDRLAHAHVHDERAILALAADRPIDAMADAWAARADYPLDAAYVAERILTIDELRTFVNALPPIVVRAPVGDDSDWDITSSSEIAGDRVMAPSWLPELLARRLMRAGRLWEAVPYFTPAHRDAALRYGTALALGAQAADPFERARALYGASGVARYDGLEILGTEVSPDWAIYDANYDPGLFGDDGDTVPDDSGSARTAALAAAAAKKLAELSATPNERIRVAASAPAFADRYHYRFVASALAEQAADLLPHRSQAFAATLCEATRYIYSIDDDRKRALYTRYLHQGPRVDFATTFGQVCPAPEIDRARRFTATPPHHRRRRFALTLLALGALLVIQARLARRAV